MDSENSSAVKKNEGKEDEELTNSMKKLQFEKSSSGSGQASVSNFKRKPVIVIVVGMAGSGNTTFMHRLVSHTHESNIRRYCSVQGGEGDETVQSWTKWWDFDFTQLVCYQV